MFLPQDRQCCHLGPLAPFCTADTLLIASSIWSENLFFLGRSPPLSSPQSNFSVMCAISCNARPLFFVLGFCFRAGPFFIFNKKKGVIPENRSGSFTRYYDMNNARRILSKGSTLLRDCWICQWSKKLPFQKNFDANFIAVIRSSNLRSSDFVIDWFRENHKTFKLIPVFDPTSEFLEMAEAMFIGSKLDTYCSIPGQFAITIHQIIHSFTPHPPNPMGRARVFRNLSAGSKCRTN